MHYYLNKILIISEIKNPIAPIASIPNAATFAVALNSSELGFLSTCQTLFDCSIKELILDK